MDFTFSEVVPENQIENLKRDWLTSLVSPQDGMWQHFRDNAAHWGIFQKEQLIGYACIDDQDRLLQFFLSPRFLRQGYPALEKFIAHKKIQKGIVGSNNPVFLSLALEFAQKIEIDTYLFREHHEVSVPSKDGQLLECGHDDIQRVVDFCHHSTGAPKEWLNSYVRGLVEKKEMFYLKNDHGIAGTCEVRKSETYPDFADIGMIVSPDHRRQGYGTFLLHQAKSIALEWGKKPICSCEKNNIGSLKAIHNSGFVSTYQLLSIEFDLE